MIRLFILLIFFTKAYGNPFYPSVNPTTSVFNLPNNQIRLIPWCPIGSGPACASSLANQALIIPQASVQSYSIPMILLNSSPVKPLSNNYDKIFPTFGKKEGKNSYVNTSRSYYRNIDTGDIQIQVSGKVISEGSLVYFPMEDLQNSTTVKSPTEDLQASPKAKSPTEDLQNSTTVKSPAEDLQTSPKAKSPAEDLQTSPKAKSPAEDLQTSPKAKSPAEDLQTSPKAKSPAEDLQTSPNVLTEAPTLDNTPNESFLPKPIVSAPLKKSLRKNLTDSVNLLLENKEINTNNPKAIIELDSDSGFRVTETILPEKLKDKCLIGGLLREKLRGGKCPTRNNNCSGKRDGFRCGAIFNSVCVSRTPVNSLSNRCMKASKGQALSKENYKRLLGDDPALEYCKIHPKNRNCQRYPQLNQLSVSSTEAEFCEDCDKQKRTSNQDILLDVSPSVLSIPFGKLLSDALYGRARCSNYNGRCSRHDRCIPGKNDRRCRKFNGKCIKTKSRTRISWKMCWLLK